MYLVQSEAFGIHSLNIGFVNLWFYQRGSMHFMHSGAFGVHSLNIGFVNSCFYKQGLKIFSLFTIEQCVFCVL